MPRSYLYKNKGGHSNCNSYWGISLLSIMGKVIARVVLTRLQVLADRIYTESQCGLGAERSTVDMIFSVRQLQEKCREQQVLYIHRLHWPHKGIRPSEQEACFSCWIRLVAPLSYSASSPPSTRTWRAWSTTTGKPQSPPQFWAA